MTNVISLFLNIEQVLTKKKTQIRILLVSIVGTRYLIWLVFILFIRSYDELNVQWTKYVRGHNKLSVITDFSIFKFVKVILSVLCYSAIIRDMIL